MPSSDDPMWTNVFVYAPLCRYAEDLPLVLAASIHNKEKLNELRLNEPVSAVRLYKQIHNVSNVYENRISTLLNKYCCSIKLAVHTLHLIVYTK